MNFINKIPIKSSRSDVKKFLEEITRIIDDKGFNIDKHFVLIRSNKDEEDYSTPYTMIDLDFATEDIVDTIRQLTVANYSETLVDRDDANPPLLFVFGKI